MKKSEAKNLKVGDLVIRTHISNDGIYEVKDIVWNDEGIPMQVTLHYVESVKYGKPYFCNVKFKDECLTYRGIRYLTDDERAELKKQRLKRARMRALRIMEREMKKMMRRPLQSEKSSEES